MIHDFTYNGETYRYDTDNPDAICVKQWDDAKRIFLYGEELAIDRPRTLREFEMCGALDVYSKSIGTLLNKVEDGQPIVYDPSSHAGEAFVRALGRSHYTDLERVRRDFFALAAICSVASIIQLRRLMLASQPAQSESDMMSMMSVAEDNTESSNDASASINPASSIDADAKTA